MARKSKIEEYELESFIDDILFENEDTPHTGEALLKESKRGNIQYGHYSIYGDKE
jgi:hypothetical protein